MSKHHRAMQQWNRWLSGFPGTKVLETEYNALSQLLPNFFGKHALLIGVPHQIKLLDATQIAKHSILSPLVSHEENILKIESGLYELPLGSGTVDLVLLPHILEYVDNPHHLLVEACRIVKPEGHIAICGFNPHSLWGLCRILHRHTNPPWNRTFLRLAQLQHWLKLADFELVKTSHGLFRPYTLHENIFNKLQFLETLGRKCHWPFGGIYILIAQAKVRPLTPIKLSWKQELSGLRLPSVGVSGNSIRNGRS